jgi:hypothetical protein
MRDAMTIAAGGLQTAFNRFNTAAARVTADPQDPAPGIVAMTQSRLAAGADLAVMRVADRMQKSLLDILA